MRVYKYELLKQALFEPVKALKYASSKSSHFRHFLFPNTYPYRDNMAPTLGLKIV